MSATVAVSLLGVMPYSGRNAQGRPVPARWQMFAHLDDGTAPQVGELWRHGVDRPTFSTYIKGRGATMHSYPSIEAALAAAGYHASSSAAA